MTVADPNLAPIITAVEADGVARISGGVGGIRFQWEELDEGALVVRAAAEELRRVWVNVEWADMRLSGVRTTGDALGLGATAAAAGAAAEGIHGCLQRLADISSTLEGAADKIIRSRMAYELAEFSTRNQMSHVLAEIVPLAPYLSRPLTLEETKTDVIQVDGTVDGLLSRVSHARDEPGSSFEVLEVEGESGPTYVVVIPGTEGNEPDLPFSAGGIVESKFADSRYVSDAVARALAEVGAVAGANVVLVGYSQGGMHAVNLANSGHLPEQYSVDLVVTAGSPVSEEDVPEETTFLHLAHEEDWVPGLNLVPVSDRPNQVSVVLDHPLKQVGPGKEDFGGPAHKIDSYREGAQAVDLSTHPSIAPITAALGTAVAGSVAKRHVFQITRPPLIGPQPAPGGTPPNEPPNERKSTDGLAPSAGDRSRNK